jgi:HAE1 family hydrophobic/amphiphilic exporter-1
MEAKRRHTLTRLTSCIVLCLALASPAFAESEEGAQQELVTFTLNQAVTLALAVNPEVLAVREKTEEFGQAVREARAEALPQLDAMLTWRKTRDPGLRNSPFFTRFAGGGDGDGQDLPPGSFDAFFFTNYLWNVEVSQPIFTFGRVSNAMDAAREERGGVNLDVQGVENRISFDTVRAAYAFLLAKHNLRVLETESVSRQRQLDRVQVRFDLQDATKLDLLRAQVTLANLKPEILTADNNLQVALASVNNTLGRPVDAPIEVLAALALPDPIPHVMRAEALLEIAGQYRPELRRFAVDRKVLDARVGLTKSALLPQIRATAGFGVNTFGAANVTDLALHTWNAGVVFDWKIYDGHRTHSQVAALRSQQTQSGYDERTFRNALSVSLKQAHGTWTRALEALEVTTLTVDQAREAERVAEESMTWGAATTLDVLQATLSLRQAELNQTTAAHDALVALAEMKYLVGFKADAPHSTIETPLLIARVETDVDEGSEP